ncbi:AMP-binding protein [Ramlibacter tataouinensis]|uniref:class I adenylate-forming enzyme family protein n=1 Tax=Ramlibacter tataouinensis TaxID=94132 RepID=UPI0022F3C3F7|nr:AMP-binding protein [Ramlibacter tataouinensis]WBY02765.1 AMP-binding protein [Ramlibacter tataouinensis]
MTVEKSALPLVTPAVGSEPANFWEIMHATARANGHRTAVISGDESLTYSVLLDRSLRLAGALAGLGLRPGDAVGTLGENTIASPEQIVGLALAGFVRVSLYAHESIETNAYLANFVGIRALIVHERHLAVLERIHRACPELKWIIVWRAVRGQYQEAAKFDYEALVADAEPLSVPPQLDVDHTHIVRFSGGTTGRPKGIYHTVKRWICACLEFERAFPTLSPEDTYLVVGQLTHASIIPFWSMLRAGAKIVLTDSFDAARTLRLIEEHHATFSVMVPTMIADLVNSPLIEKFDLSSLRAIHYGAAPISEATLKAAISCFGHALFQAYAQSEAWPVSVLTPEDHAAGGKRLRSVGKSTPNTQVVAVDGNGEPLPPGQVGELAVRAQGMMSGYWNDPEGLARKLTPDGALLSGDVGYVDEDGYIFLVNRKNDLIISGGYNIWPAELEVVIERHPAVREVCVFGVPHPRWGETPMAAVVLEPEGSASEEELIALTREQLGAVKKATAVVFLDELPRNALGKILRNELRQPYWEGRNAQIAGS